MYFTAHFTFLFALSWGARTKKKVSRDNAEGIYINDISVLVCQESSLNLGSGHLSPGKETPS